MGYRWELTAVTCLFNAKVNRCLPLDLEGRNVNVACTHQNAWGSNCTFSCASGFKRRGFAKTRCRNDLTWSHKIPKCIRKPARGECKVPAFYGKFECHSGDQMAATECVASGTICELSCFDGYFIPRSQRHLATIRCVEGRWNSTEDPVCLPIPTRSPSKPTQRKINMPLHKNKKSKPTMRHKKANTRYIIIT